MKQRTTTLKEVDCVTFDKSISGFQMVIKNEKHKIILNFQDNWWMGYFGEQLWKMYKECEASLLRLKNQLKGDEQ